MKRLRVQSGFTLVEILLVVVLLAILAAVLIAQFANVSRDGKKSALVDQIRSIRAQIALYKMQHGDTNPALSGSDWTALTQQSTHLGRLYGPYFYSIPMNSMNQYSDIAVVAADVNAGDPVAGANIGFVYNSSNGYIWATTQSGAMVFNEDNVDDPNNNN